MMYGVKKHIPDVAEMLVLHPKRYLHERHAYLERKMQQGWLMCRCLCGDCLDEKRELAGYRTKRANQGKAESAKERVERLVQEFRALTDKEKKEVMP